MLIAVHQPQYLPWLGYFHKIDRADRFVLLDNVQFKKNEWQNRNRIKTAQGWQWLTVPVKYKFSQKIHEVEINPDVPWQRKHRQAILTNYGKAAHGAYLDALFEDLFSRSWHSISRLNIHLVKSLARILGIDTPIFIASELGDFPSDPDERLIALTRHFGADQYLAGRGGRDYMNLEKYKEKGVSVVFQDFNHPEYGQLFGDFQPNMSVIDLLLNHGEQSLSLIRGRK